jgi:hypothetical protein
LVRIQLPRPKTPLIPLPFSLAILTRGSYAVPSSFAARDLLRASATSTIFVRRRT